MLFCALILQLFSDECLHKSSEFFWQEALTNLAAFTTLIESLQAQRYLLEHALSVMIIDVEPVHFVPLSIIVDHFELAGSFLFVLQVLVVDFVQAFLVDRYRIDHLPDIEIEEEVVEKVMNEFNCSHLVAL